MSHRTFTQRLFLLLALTLALVIFGAVTYTAASEARTRCAEDQPCWNWATMGNMERGIHVIDDAPDVGRAIPNRRGRWLSVTPCEYSYLAHEGYLARGNRRLKGDRLAKRHGCDYRYFG